MATFFRPGASLLATLPADHQGVTHLNLAGDYSYMSAGYYSSLEAELMGWQVLPDTADSLDAYLVPVALEKARLHDLPVPGYSVVVDKLTPPVLAYPINPFSSYGKLVLPGDDLKKKLKSLTRTGTYATLVQHLPEDYRLDVVRCVMGHTSHGAYADFARSVFAVFTLPLMRVRVIVTPQAFLFSAVEPLPLGELTVEERARLEGLGSWHA